MVDQAQEVTPSADVALWLDFIEDAQKDMRDYRRRCDKIDKRYRYEAAQKTKRRKFQMLWANQEILRPPPMPVGRALTSRTDGRRATP